MEGVANLPDVSISFGDSVLGGRRLTSVDAIRVQQRLSEPSLCEIAVGDPSLLPPGTSFDVGSKLTVRVATHVLFAGETTAVEYEYGPAGRRIVRVRGYDVLHRLRKTTTVETRGGLGLSGLARALTDGLPLEIVNHVRGPEPSWERLLQFQESDLACLQIWSERAGVYFFVEPGDEQRLHLMTLEGQGGTLQLTLGEGLFEARVEVSSEPACRSVRTNAWGPLQAVGFDSLLDAPRIGTSVGADPSPSRFDISGERWVVGTAVHDAVHADLRGQAALDRSVARGVTLGGVADGNAELQPGRMVTIEGVDSEIAGAFVLTAATHTIDTEKGFVTEISSVPPPPRERESPDSVTLGTVTNVADPRKAGRVRCSLPAFNQIETDWMQVVLPAAGPKKGLTALPDVGDAVLVILAGGEPGSGVVLGGLYGLDGPPDSGVSGRSVRRYTFTTPKGQTIVLNDEEGSVSLRNGDESLIEITPKRVRIKVNGDLDLEAPGNTVTIRAARIDMEQG